MIASLLDSYVRREAMGGAARSIMGHVVDFSERPPASSRRYPPLPAAAERVLSEEDPVLSAAQIQALAYAAPVESAGNDPEQLARSLGLTPAPATLPDHAPAHIAGTFLLFDDSHGARFWLLLWGCARATLVRHGHEPYRADTWVLARALARGLSGVGKGRRTVQ